MAGDIDHNCHFRSELECLSNIRVISWFRIHILSLVLSIYCTFSSTFVSLARCWHTPCTSLTRALAPNTHSQGDFMKKQKGFSLIELLIVVAIILIIAAIAIPNLMRARMSANESAAAGSLRTMNTAEVSYNAAYQTFGTLAQLGGAIPCTPAAATGCFIDNVLATDNGGAGKDGYSYTDVGAPTAG